MTIKTREMFPQEVTLAGMTYFLADAYNAAYYNLSPLKTNEFLLNNITEFISHLTGNTLRLCYKDQPVNAVYVNTRLL
jgi:hypothetical protein